MAILLIVVNIAYNSVLYIHFAHFLIALFYLDNDIYYGDFGHCKAILEQCSHRLTTH